MSDVIRSWDEYYGYRERVKAKYPTIWDVPIVKKELSRLLPNVGDGTKVLEVGAGDRRFAGKIRAAGKDIIYESMDIDPDTHQDYYSLDDIKPGYDFIYMFEVIEHLSLSEGFSVLSKMHELLNEGGKALLGTPNIYHPNRYHGVITHCSPYKYEDLAALTLMAGFSDVRVYRMYNDAFLKRLFRLSVGVWLHRYLGIDFAGTILIEADR